MFLRFQVSPHSSPNSTMWALFLFISLQVIHAQNTTVNGTITCTHDALYTSLAESGVDFCSDVVREGGCGAGYGTPSGFATVDETRIASYVSFHLLRMSLEFGNMC